MPCGEILGDLAVNVEDLKMWHCCWLKIFKIEKWRFYKKNYQPFNHQIIGYLRGFFWSDFRFMTNITCFSGWAGQGEYMGNQGLTRLIITRPKIWSCGGFPEGSPGWFTASVFHKHPLLSCVQNIWLMMMDYKDMIIYIWYILYRYMYYISIYPFYLLDHLHLQLTPGQSEQA